LSEKSAVKRKAVKSGNGNRMQSERIPGVLSICEDSLCPQQSLCLKQGLSVFLIMGKGCTRHCKLCENGGTNPSALDPEEPLNVANSVRRLNSTYVVLTSYTRDDLNDGGVAHLAKTARLVHEMNPGTTVELMLHSCLSDSAALETILECAPEVVTHSVRTVPRLNSQICDKADYVASLKLLKKIKQAKADIVTKSGLMLGLGESNYEVLGVISDLRDVDCDCITLNQYLPPTERQDQPYRYVAPWEFTEYQGLSLQMGYSSARANPFSCKSFDALTMYREIAE
jgi:lipoic acid synthetase